MKNININKTLKMFVAGEFPRSESGRSFAFINSHGHEYARLCQASRKDLRNAVEVAQAAWPSWAKRDAYNRGQILYRMAEMLQGKTDEVRDILVKALEINAAAANKEIEAAIDSLIHFAGWSDKYTQVSGAINLVNGPFHNFTTPSPVGVVLVLDQEVLHLSHLMSTIGAALVGGNSLIVLLGEKHQVLVSLLGEIFKTSDLPSGVVNLLTGHQKELLPHAASHGDIRSIIYLGSDAPVILDLQKAAITNLKRIVTKSDLFDQQERMGLNAIMKLTEMQTVWHPIGV